MPNKISWLYLLLLIFILSGCSRSVLKVSGFKETPEKKNLENKDQAYGLFIRAYAFEATGDIEAAAKSYEEVAAVDSEAYTVHYWLARYYLEKNELSKSFKEIAFLLKRDSLPDYLTLNGILLVKSGKYNEAKAALSAALKKAPDDARIKEMLASLFEKGGEINEAVSIYKELSINPELQDGMEEKLLSLYVQTKNTTEALKLTRKILLQNPSSSTARISLFSLGGMVSSPDSVLSIYRDVLAVDSGNINLKKDLAGLLIKLDRLGAADSLYSLMMKTNPGQVDHKMFGIILATENKNKEAISVLAPLLLEKNDADVAFYLGNAYLDTKQYQNAVNAYSLCVGLDSLNQSAWMNKGIAFLRMERFDSAQALFQSLSVRFPDKGEYDYMLGMSFGGENKYSDAKNAYATALKKDPENLEIIFSLASVYERLNDFSMSENLFLKILSKDSLHARTLNYLGYMYAERDTNIETAEKYIRSALKKEPANGAFLDSYAWVLYRMKRYQEAEDYALRAIESREEDAVIFEHTALIKQALNKQQEALSYWKKVLKLEPQNEKAKKAIQVP